MFRNVFLFLQLARLFKGRVSEERAAGIVRHALTTLGGFLVGRGLITPDMVEPMIGIAMTAWGAIWSLIDKQAKA